MRLFLSVIRKNPDVVVAPLRAIRGEVEVFYGAIDASERPVRKARGRPAAMRKLIVTEKVYMHGGQASGDVHLST
ncbi:MAG: hypothetical protein WCD63_17235, partial [Terrimicrobiaceae bacterium]